MDELLENIRALNANGSFKVGFGYDIHQLVSSRKLIIGGVEIDYHLGALAHSDGDVLIHSLIDAILTGIGEVDIGSHFPDTDLKYKNIDSIILLHEISQKIHQQNYTIENISATVILQDPKIADYIPLMKIKLANVLKIKTSQIGIAAKTNERIGLVGENKAIASFSVILLSKKTSE